METTTKAQGRKIAVRPRELSTHSALFLPTITVGGLWLLLWTRRLRIALTPARGT
jgi:hypothetical protein